MKLPSIVNFGLKLVLMAGVNQVLTNIVSATTPTDIKPIKQLFINIGKLAISEAVAGVVANQVIVDIEEALTMIPPMEKKKESEPTPTEHPVGMTKEEFSTFNKEYVKEVVNQQSKKEGTDGGA